MNIDDASQATLLAGAAVSVCGTWRDPEKRREQVLAYWSASFGSPPGLLAEAAGAVAGLPKPLADDVKDIERMERIRQMLGASTPEQELLEMIDARALLEDLAREFG